MLWWCAFIVLPSAQLKVVGGGDFVTPQRSWGFFYCAPVRLGYCMVDEVLLSLLHFNKRCAPNTVSQCMHNGFIYGARPSTYGGPFERVSWDALSHQNMT
eukprot:6206295-Ditylum_brightwellii.AAC.1